MPDKNGKAPLILVVGPSGAGKDSLLDAARLQLAGDEGIVFARRVITRPAGSGGEDHQAAGIPEFEAMLDNGDFMLSWQAHGLHYGIPKQLERHRDQGRCLIANVSRGVLDQARLQYGPVTVLHVTAPPEILAQRLAKRGRESEADIHARLKREDSGLKGQADVVEINNAGKLEDAADRFLAAIYQIQREYRTLRTAETV